MKESIIKAKNEAKEMSLKHKDIGYWVMDKKRCGAKVYSDMILNSTLFRYDIIRSGYYPYCVYRNGIEYNR